MVDPSGVALALMKGAGLPFVIAVDESLPWEREGM